MITDFYPIQQNPLSKIYKKMEAETISMMESEGTTQDTVCKYIVGTLKRNKFNVPEDKSELLSMVGAKSIRELCIHAYYNICRVTENGTFLIWIAAYGVRRKDCTELAYIVKVSLNTKEHAMNMPFP